MSNNNIDNRTLPKKDYDIFRSLVKYYEDKQYKKGIKYADILLKKYPNHGETQAMKGLILNSLGKKSESYELVKLGLKNDVRSHVCWHVFGLLYRSDRNYKEAIKCYLNALRIDKDNQNILRDLSFLQIQMRDMSGFADTRRKILVLKPSNKIHWITYAIALFFDKNYQTANEVISKFLESSLEEKGLYEQSELYLFQNRCLEASGKFQEALDQLENSKSFIVDLLSYKIKKGELYIQLGRFNEGLEQFKLLLSEQPDNYRFHSAYQICLLQLPQQLATEMLSLQKLELPSTVLQLNSEQITTLRIAYENINLRSSAPTRILLSLYPIETNQNDFKIYVGNYIKKGLRSGIPNLYNDLCALIRVPDLTQPNRLIYAKDSKDYESHPITHLIIELLNDFINSLLNNGTFDSNPADDAIVEVPTTLLWAYYLRAHMLSVCGRNEEALVDIEKSIDHTPTSLDSLAKRAKILKNLGDYNGASEQMNYCRSLDLQDRYVNNKATKYYLRANRVEDGMNTIAMFTKHDGDPQQTLFDLQCIWYELEAGEAYSRKGMYGQALKKFYAIEKHFTDFIEDLFDFHAFSMRKTTLRAYLDMVETTDNLLTHKFFQRAGQNVLEIMLRRLNQPPTKLSTNETETTTTTMTAAERKKQKKLAKKEENAAAAAAAANNTLQSDSDKKQANNKKVANNTAVQDEDPNGDKILEKDILEESTRWCQHLTKGGKCKDPKTLALVCEVMLKKEKYLLALRCITSGLSIDVNHPLVNYQLFSFTKQFYQHIGLSSSSSPVTDETSPKKPIPSVVEDVIREKLQSILGGEGEGFLINYIESFIQKSLTSDFSINHRVAAAKAIMNYLENIELGQRKERVNSILLDEQLWNQRGINYKNIFSIIQNLDNDPQNTFERTTIETFKQNVQNKFSRVDTPIYKGVLDLELTDA